MVELAVYMVDIAGRVSSCTTAAQDFQGYAVAEIVGEPFERLFCEEDRLAGRPSALLATAQEQSKAGYAGWLVRKDGSRFWAKAEIDAICDGEGAIQGFAVVIANTPQSVMGDAAGASFPSASCHLANDSALPASAYGLAHDINNMLAVISASVDLISRYPADVQRVQRMADNIKQAISRAECLTKLLSPSAIERSAAADPLAPSDPLNDIATCLISAMSTEKALETTVVHEKQ